jgi:DNA-binding GntR family transcriptional regulator
MNIVRRTCMRDQIRDAIVTRILDNRFPPGTHLKELVLAREFNVSQAPVREALRELETLGIVVSERYKGTRVRNPNKRELSEAYELRAILEERAAQLAIPCDTSDLAQLHSILDTMRIAANNNDYASYASATVKFHRQIMVMSHNTFFLKTWESMLWEVRTRIAVQLLSYDLAPFLDAHTRVIAALEHHDGNLAGSLLRKLLEIPKVDLVKDINRDPA